MLEETLNDGTDQQGDHCQNTPTSSWVLLRHKYKQ